jgi:hypothetical protein
MLASLDPTTILSTHPHPHLPITVAARTTSPPALAPSPSTSFAKLSLLSPIVPAPVPSSSLSSSSSSSSSSSLPLSPHHSSPIPHNTYPHAVPRHDTTSPSPLSQSQSHPQNGHTLSFPFSSLEGGIVENGEEEGRKKTSLVGESSSSSVPGHLRISRLRLLSNGNRF